MVPTPESPVEGNQFATTVDVFESEKKRYSVDDFYKTLTSMDIKKEKSGWEDEIEIPMPISTDTPWNELTTKGKILRVLKAIGKGISLLFLLYCFVCSLDLLSLGFRIIGGRTTGEIFRNSAFLQNPIVGVMVGVITTVLVQSSSTSSSIIVSMVSAEFLEVQTAIPVIMGANIGTSITNSIVSLTQAGNKEQFRRAFAGATVHDMFNILCVISLLIVEVTTGYLYHVSTAIVDGIAPGAAGGEVQILSVITDPFVDLIVQIDNDVLECWSKEGCTEHDDSSLIKEMCTVEDADSKSAPLLSSDLFMSSSTTEISENKEPCSFLFAGTSMSDELAGAIILVSSLTVLCVCLVLIVKLLNSVLQGQIAVVIKKTLNSKIPYAPWLTGYIAIVVGAIMTFLVQSSSVFTSALTPLVGLGVLTVERVYPLTLGSNIGTTTTSILASLAVEGSTFKASLQVALCHLFFNISGILLFYPVPFMRFPIAMAKALGDATANYRWFAIVYMLFMFLVMPAIFMGLSFAGSVFVIIFTAIIGLVVAFICSVNLLRSHKPEWLPKKLQTWDWTPIWCRSLAPYDKVVTKMMCCCRKKLQRADQGTSNDAYVPDVEQG